MVCLPFILQIYDSWWLSLKFLRKELDGKVLIDNGIGVRFPEGAAHFLLATASRLAVKPTQLPVQWVLVGLSLGIKRQEREADD
jgi:hypothetical protein